MTHIIGYTALSLNIISMSMKNLLYLRVCSLIANTIYILYGVLLNAPPMIIGCSIAVIIHIYRIHRFLMEKKEVQSNV
jgi:hypothetical protein